jgi:ABC-type uncharacterized transport system substrate-binding protein
VEALNEIAPQVSHVGFILHPETPGTVKQFRVAEAAAPSGVKLIALGVHNTAEIESAITAFAAETNGGLIVAPRMLLLLQIAMSSSNWRHAIAFPPFIRFVLSRPVVA